MTNWNSLLTKGGQVTDEYTRLYKEFMYNPDNEYNCQGCPENLEETMGISVSGYSCGQQNCWVTCHCH